MTREILSELAAMQKRIEAIYYKFVGLEGIGEDSIQIRADEFIKLFPVGYTVKEKYSIKFPYEYSIIHDGVKVICISDKPIECYGCTELCSDMRSGVECKNYEMKGSI